MDYTADCWRGRQRGREVRDWQRKQETRVHNTWTSKPAWVASS